MLEKRLQKTEDLKEAEALANEIAQKREEEATARRIAALGKYNEDTKNYWKHKGEGQKSHVKVLRESHEKKRQEYEATVGGAQ